MSLPDALAAEIEDGWNLSSVTFVEERVSYSTRAVLLGTSEQGPFALKLFKDRHPDKVAADLETLAGVRDRGFAHAPDIWRTTTGLLTQPTSAGPAVLMEQVATDAADASTWGDIGSALASLNALRCPRPFGIPVAAALREQIERSEDGEYASAVGSLVKRLAHLGSLPADGIVHGEANPSNVGRRATGELVLLDWDHAGLGTQALDYGYPLITCFISESLAIDETAIEAFYDAYRDGGGTVDVSLAMDAALFHALRYMWFANTPARWERIQFALRCEDELLGLLN